MEKSTTSLLLLGVIGCLLLEVTVQQCSTIGINGIIGCQCNFMEACDAQGDPKNNWAQYLPTDVNQYGLVVGRQRNLAYLCEVGAVAILYDCNNRIPLYAATVINGTQLSGRSLFGRPGKKFRRSHLNWLLRHYQQENGDYVSATKRELCYTTQIQNRYIVDNDWVSAKTGSRKRLRGPCPQGSSRIKTSIHVGHLIASQYGRNNKAKMIATFTYTNAVPQFGVFNSQPWRVCESRLISWGNQNCARVRGATNVEMFIVVGAVPSTVFGSTKQRYFGKKGFSDYKDNIGDYRVNVPQDMWTAACCKYKVNRVWNYHSTAFWRENNPGKAPCNREDIGTLSRRLSRWISPGTNVNLFLQTPQCNNRNNYVPLP